MTTSRQRPDRLFAIVDGQDRSLLDLCTGPDDEGHCARRAPGAVPCAAARVVPLRGTRADGLPFSVPADAMGPTCPMAWVDHP